MKEHKARLLEQVEQIYEFFSSKKEFSKLIPEVRTNISGALPHAKDGGSVAAVDGRITIVNGYPKKCGEIKLGASDHTARLLLTAREYDETINFVMNLKYKHEYIQKISDHTDLSMTEFKRGLQPEQVKKKEHSTMQWLIRQSVKGEGKIPTLIWDEGDMGKEPMMRLFARNSGDMMDKLDTILGAIMNS